MGAESFKPALTVICLMTAIVAVSSTMKYTAPVVSFEDSCNKTINIGNKSIVLHLKSAESFNKYGNHCRVSLVTHKGWKLRFNITYLGFSGNDVPIFGTAKFTNYMYILHPDGTRLSQCRIFGDFDLEEDKKPGVHFHFVPVCGSLKDYYAPADGHGLKVDFYGAHPLTTFKAVITAFEDGGCYKKDKNLFRCDNQRCLNHSLVFDEVDNCGDGSDVHAYQEMIKDDTHNHAIYIAVGTAVVTTVFVIGLTLFVRFIVRRRQANMFVYRAQVNM